MRRALLPIALLACALVPGTAGARIIRGVNILPPGQSGFVSTAGLANGTGSPHLYDQQPLFTRFQWKSEMFDRGGSMSSPRNGVTITRDAYGVPDVHATDVHGLWFGAGYAIAQDRLFQLELFRRATRGRLAEILGKGYLDSDIIARRDYYTPAELDRMFARIPAALHARFLDYRDGINAWIAQAQANPIQNMPGEFAAVNDLPIAPWTLQDSLAVGVYLARTVPSGDGNELENLAALRSAGPRVFDQLLPLRTPGQVIAVPPQNGRFPSQPGRTHRQERAAFLRSRRELRGLPLPTPGAQTASLRAKRDVAPGMIGQLGGSYMFAVRRPRDHHAFVFNGPQLGFSAPELFVEVELHGPGLDARGVTAAGVPLVAIGHNKHLAWGYTSGLSDDNDLYADRVVGGESYRFRGRTRGMSCRTETFTYRSPPPTGSSSLLRLIKDPTHTSGQQTERICRTVHGPVQVRAGHVAYARRYATWGRELETLVGLTQLSQAGSVAAVNRAMLHVTWNENVVAGDDHGHIGYWHPGLHPLRPLRYDERLPYPGGGNAEWRGFLPRSRDPHVIDPRRGWVASWNNVPSAGWTAGDGPARERLDGPFHRSGYLYSLVARLARHPSLSGAQDVIRHTGTISQARPLDGRRLRIAFHGSHGRAAAVLRVLLRWNGSYSRVDGNNTVSPGVATWEEFKHQVQGVAIPSLRKLPQPIAGGETMVGETSNSHMFDTTNGEAYGLRTLRARGYRSAAVRAYYALAHRFGTTNTARWREPRRLYPESAQGAGSPPDLPFFDRGTWEHFDEVGP
ncbi:MAG: penicillin amidase [Solirubrobacteraceae bacterium]|jgi:acyl-homoserine lactone acylase PvdQ|nr:penicillin amidase [Solirubrobacteraceae bacterium]